MKNLGVGLSIFILVTMLGCKDSSKKEVMQTRESIDEMSTNVKKESDMNKTGAFLEITLKVDEKNRTAAGGVYVKYKEPFLSQIAGATSKELLMRDMDVQVLHGFETEEQANSYLTTELFSEDIVGELGPLLESDPEVRIYSVFR